MQAYQHFSRPFRLALTSELPAASDRTTVAGGWFATTTFHWAISPSVSRPWARACHLTISGPGAVSSPAAAVSSPAAAVSSPAVAVSSPAAAVSSPVAAVSSPAAAVSSPAAPPQPSSLPPPRLPAAEAADGARSNIHTQLSRSGPSCRSRQIPLGRLHLPQYKGAWSWRRVSSGDGGAPGAS